MANNLVVIDKKQYEAMIGELPFTQDQLNLLMKQTPEKYIHERIMPGGGTAKYVSGHYITNVLNYLTGFQWDFDILDEKEKHGQIVLKGKLSITSQKGTIISKTQYGRASIKVYSEKIKLKNGSYVPRTDGKAGQPVDYGNDFKAAATDALKKCASLFGIAWDVYGQEDLKQMKIEDEPVVDSSDDIPHNAPVIPFDDVKTLVDIRLVRMQPAEKAKFLRDHAGTVSDKKLDEKQYRYLYEILSMEKKDGKQS